MDTAEMVYCATREEWRGWLEQNHDKSKGIWLIYYKKGSGKPRVPYDDAVEEALCFGWIDSTVRRIDEEKYAQRYHAPEAGQRVVGAEYAAHGAVDQGRPDDRGGIGEVQRPGCPQVDDQGYGQCYTAGLYGSAGERPEGAGIF